MEPAIDPPLAPPRRGKAAGDLSVKYKSYLPLGDRGRGVGTHPLTQPTPARSTPPPLPSWERGGEPGRPSPNPTHPRPSQEGNPEGECRV